MVEVSTKHKGGDVPSQVFEAFLKNLENESISQEMIERLRKVLVDDKTYSERVLKEAVIPEEPSS